MGKRIAFNVTEAISKAWDVLWAANLAQRKKEKVGRWANRTYYLCAADLERQVRAWAAETKDGKPWTMKPMNFGGYGSGIRFSGDLERTVRNWLFANRNLTHHNFGRGHISGARFRPVGEPISPSEKETLVKHEKAKAKGYVRPHHFSENFGGRPLCVRERMKGRWSFRSSKAWSTSKKADVTCKACNNLLLTYVPKAARQTEDA